MTSWNDPASWPGGVIPGPDDTAIVDRAITLTGDAVCCGVIVTSTGHLTFDPAHSAKISCCCSVVVDDGVLEMQPASSAVKHEILFTGINEAAFVGGPWTMALMESDVGLVVMGAGRVILTGTNRVGWVANLNATDASWKTGDRIIMTPFNVGDFSSFKPKAGPALRVIYDGVTHFQEAMNMTRNVVIGGTGNGEAHPVGNGRAHVMIMSNGPQTIKNVYFHDLGPRQLTGDPNFPTKNVLGRWGLHFHLMGDAARGSVVENCVVERCGSHAFVPHKSHGELFDNCIAFNTFDEAYWWDLDTPTTLNQSDDVTYRHCIAAFTRFDPPQRAFRTAGFALLPGRNNTIVDCVAVGTQSVTSGAGFSWMEAPDFRRFLTNPPEDTTPWRVERCVSHNNQRNGWFAWVNSQQVHHVVDCVSFRDGNNAIEHGAYTNCFSYENFRCYEPGATAIACEATSHPDPDPSKRLQFLNCIFGAGAHYCIGFTAHAANPPTPNILFTNCQLRSTNPSAINLNEKPELSASRPGAAVFIGCTFNGQPLATQHVQITGMHKDSVYTIVPPTGTPKQLTAPWHDVPPGWAP